VVQQTKAESARLREQIEQSETALRSSYEEQRLLKSTIETLKRQMCE